MGGTTIILIFGPLLVGIFLYVVLFYLIKAPGRALQTKFVSLGVLKGKTKEEIIKTVGLPNAISGAPNGGQLLQWIPTGYHIALLFDKEGICQGVTHQFKA